MERQRITVRWEAKIMEEKAKKKKNPSLQFPVSTEASFLPLLEMTKLTGQMFGVG